MEPVEEVHAQVAVLVADRLGGFDGAAPRKDPQPPKQRLLRRVEQVIAPGNRLPQRLLTGW